ncbi:MAG: hypothetical protein NTAFB01_03760 [Nitrospira sp.]
MRSETQSSNPSPCSFPAKGNKGRGYPHLLTQLEFNHVAPLPSGRSPDVLRQLAREQVTANKLPTFLALAPDFCLYLSPNGTEFLLDETPHSPLVVSGFLEPVRRVEWTAADQIRQDEFSEWAKRTLEGCTKQAACLGLNGRARAVSELVGRNFGDPVVVFPPRRHQVGNIHRVAVHCHRRQCPLGLTRCGLCGEWKGTCTVTESGIEGTRVVPVLCRCANDNYCAGCGGLLAERKLGSVYFLGESETLWYYPGYKAFTHRCGKHRKEHHDDVESTDTSYEKTLG